MRAGYGNLVIEAKKRGIDISLIARGAKLDLETPPKWFHAGQLEAWESEEEVILLLAGRQSGKTVFGPWWLAREIQRRGPGDYGFNGPTLELLKKKAIGEFLRVFGRVLRLGTYKVGDRQFIFSQEGLKRIFGTVDYDELLEKYGWRDEDGEILDPEFEVKVVIHIGYATKPDSLESSTFKAVWSDEPGQEDFKLESFEALQGRRARYGARHLMTTTPYNLGWLKQKIYDVYEAAKAEGLKTFCKVVRFESWMNPAFGREQFEKIRESGLAEWKFNLFYRAIFTRPAGSVYDIFDRRKHTFKRREVEITDDWPRAIGADFGTINMASVKVWMDPLTLMDPLGPMCYVYRSYHKQGITKEHAEAITSGEPFVPDAVGGNQTNEDGWRESFGSHGLWIDKPTVGAVDTQIDYVYAAFKNNRLKIADDLEKLLSEIENIAYELDENGEPMQKKIKNEAKYHRHAALRYVISEIYANPGFARARDIVPLGLPIDPSVVSAYYGS